MLNNLPDIEKIITQYVKDYDVVLDCFSLVRLYVTCLFGKNCPGKMQRLLIVCCIVSISVVYAT